MLESVLYDQLRTLGIPIVPVGPGSTDELDLSQQPIPSICYVRHSTAPELDLMGVIQCEIIDMEIMILGNSFAEAATYSAQVKTLLSNQTYSGYDFTLYNELTQQKNFIIVQYWNIFYSAMD